MAKFCFATLSIGSLADRLARVVGWSPKTKTVLISEVEGPAADTFEGMTGVVRSVEGTVMVVEPNRTADSKWAQGAQLRITARHRGWTPFSLYLRPIAVTVEAVQSDGRPGVVAIGIAAIVRQRSSAKGG